MKKNVLKVLATYRGTGGRCTENENILTPRFDVVPGQIAKAIRAQVYWLGKAISISIRREGTKGTQGEKIGKAYGFLRAIDVKEDRRSTWYFHFSVRDEGAVSWIANAFQTNVILTMKKS